VLVLSAAVLVLSAAVLVLSAAVLVLESRRKISKPHSAGFPVQTVRF
jgi:hypothetical protein